MNPLHFFGICFPHSWGTWSVFDNTLGRFGGWRTANPGEPAIRRCAHCNTPQVRFGYPLPRE
jgi:hypothetical protein